MAAPRTWPELAEPGLRHLDYREVLDRLVDGIDPMTSFWQPAAVAAAAAAHAPARSPRTSVQLGRTVQPARPLRPQALHTPQIVGRRSGEFELPTDLAGPVDLTLAKAQDTLPERFAMPGGTWYELKFDGFRGAIVVDSGGARLWSRQRKDMTGAFPEIAIAAGRLLPKGTVVDGELCIWSGERLNFDLLQQRLAGGRARIAQLAATNPASFIVFDVLAVRGQDLRRRPLRERRAALEELAAAWSPPLQLSPVTDDLATARDWMISHRPAGIEGIVAKGADSLYEPGARRWIKVKTRETAEVIVGAVTGPITRPESIIAGMYRDGRLIIVGRSVPLTPAQARSLAPLLEPASSDHPWPETIIANRFGKSRDRTELTKVVPTVVAEVAADSAQQGGVWRHPLRFLRYRPDLDAEDLPIPR